MSEKKHSTRLYSSALTIGLGLLSFCLTSSRAQAQTPGESAGKNTGDYNIQQTVEFGYRDSMIGGNLANYSTFENLNSGVRLFDYTVDMRSIDHRGILFDNLSFSNFGYGGDPNIVSRLRITTNSPRFKN